MPGPTLTKEVVVIFGATSGIGEATASLFAKTGYTVMAIGRNKKALETLKTAHSDKIITIAADLTDDEALKQLALHFDSSTKIKFVIYCAGTAEPFAPLTTISIPALRKNIELNAIAPVSLVQILAPHYLPGARFLILGSSYVDLRATINPYLTGAYAMGKTASRAAVEYLRHETRGNPHIGYFNPGATLTPMYREFCQKIENHGGSTHDWQPVDPAEIASFIIGILRNTTDKVFSGTDWNFENEAHRYQSARRPASPPPVKSRTWDPRNLALGVAGVMALGIFARILSHEKTTTPAKTLALKGP